MVERPDKDEPRTPRDEDDDRTLIEATEFASLPGDTGNDAEALARIGGYRLLELLGKGGMGSVWLAEQQHPVQRKVALKLVRSSVLDGLAKALFEVERQMLAQMAHPCIAQVYDAGSTEEGRPWFAMEWVPGEPITTYATDQGMDADDRIRLFMRICQGVQHAHERGIIHRDLKPANVLVYSIDGDHLPKIIDFGIATSLHDEGDAPQANSSDKAGTQAYMSPEQYAEDTQRIDTRSDVYALGVMLFELLTGARPPSTAQPDALETFHTSLGRRQTDQAHSIPDAAEAFDAARALNRELRFILARALAPDREDRYASAAELARDLERYLSDQVVEAVPMSRGYRWGKFARRNRLALSASALVMLALVSGLALALWGLIQAQSERDRAQLAATRAEQTSDFVINMLDSIDPDYASGADTALMRRVLDDAALRAGDELAEQPDILAQIALTIGGAYLAIGEDTSAAEHLDRAESLSADREDLLRLNLRAGLQLTTLDVRLGEPGRALERVERLVELTRTTLPPGDILRLDARSLQAHALHRLSDIEAAEPIILEVIAAATADEPPIRRVRLESLQTLGQMHSDRMQMEQAYEAFERILREIEEANDPALRELSLSVKNDVAVAYLREQRFAEAEAPLRELLDVRRSLFGDRHPMTLSAISNLAGSLRQQGRPNDALPFYQESMEGLLDLYGPLHPNSLIARYNLGNCLLDLDRADESVVLHREALRDARQELPNNSFMLGMFELGLGKSALAIGNADQAIELLTSANALISEAASPDHYRANEAREFLAQAQLLADGNQ
ncbi:MAG: protein kinase [Pseudomonadota bacterium]